MKEIFINYLPTIIACFIYTLGIFKYIGTLTHLADDIKQSTSFSKLENSFKIILEENYELKKQVGELLEELKKERESKEDTPLEEE